MKRYLFGLLFILTVFQSFTQNTDTNFVVIYDVPQFDITKWYIQTNDSVKDIDGNYYHIIKLGNQIWLKENLKVTRYNNGNPIHLIQDSLAWVKTDTGAYSIYNHSSKDSIFYYNYTVVKNNNNVCPCGWKIPDSSDWKVLENYVDIVNLDFLNGRGLFYFGNGNDTLHLRKKIINVFESDIKGLSFSNQPFGYRSGITGDFIYFGDYGFWWAASGEEIASAWARIFIDRGFGIDDIHLDELFYNKTDYGFIKNNGLTIRCIKENE